MEELQKSFYIIQNIKLDNLEDHFINEFHENTKNSSKIQLFLSIILDTIKPLIETLLVLFFLFILYFSYKTFSYSREEIIVIIGFFIICLFRILPSTNRIFSCYNSFTFYKGTFNLLFQELENLNFLKTKSDNNFLIQFKNSIELKNIKFQYNQNTIVLDDINLKIEKNDFIGILGESGSGKSTLLNIICGLIDPDSGEYLIDNQKIKSLNDLYNFRSQIGYVQQKTYLFQGSLLNNIILGLNKKNRVSKFLLDEVIKTCKLSYLVERSNLKENQLINERGLNLSGGEQQRISIARALYKQSEILILDEATSSLDEENEKHILNIISDLRKKKTIIFVTHKKNLLEKCNKIYVFKNKKLIRYK